MVEAIVCRGRKLHKIHEDPCVLENNWPGRPNNMEHRALTHDGHRELQSWPDVKEKMCVVNCFLSTHCVPTMQIFTELSSIVEVGPSAIEIVDANDLELEFFWQPVHCNVLLADFIFEKQKNLCK